MVSYYNIFTLDAKTITNFPVKIKIQKGNPAYSLSVTDMKSCIVQTERRRENAFFAQIKKYLLEQEEEDSSQKTDSQDEDFLKNIILYLDFEKFKKIFDKENGDDKNSEDECVKKLIEYGFEIEYSQESKHFIPFIFSASNARNYLLIFIDKSLLLSSNKKPNIKERLNIGLNFEGNNVRKSKYYAYMGLYLSDGERIDAVRATDVRKGCEDDLVFDEKTVIVVDDKVVSGVVPQISGKLDASGKLKKVQERESIIDINCFDGQGLICPDYAKLINKKMDTMEATSFQFRMPYCKGMLHEVDWKTFISNEILKGINLDEKQAKDVWCVYDVFGVKRDLRDAKIVLTKSQFKLFQWIKNDDFIKEDDKSLDKMALYFKQFHSYDHALYITGTNLGIKKSQNTISLNYQFLSTIVSSEEQLEKLVKNHLHYWENIEADPYKLKDLLLGADDESAEATEEAETWKYALNDDVSFIKEPMIDSMVRSMKRAHQMKIFIGQLKTAGCQRYLTADLLDMLLHIVFSCKRSKTGNELNIPENLKNNKLEELKKHRIFENSFYLPKSGSLQKNQWYPILRNPHLSRNEIAFARCYKPPKIDPLYRYFNHLSGVLMLSSKSTAAMRMSGADFDGDLVKMIFDESLISSITKESFTYNKNTKSYESKFRVVNIDSPIESAVKLKAIDYQFIKNTFGGKVGLISNIAFKLSQLHYFQKDESGENQAQQEDESSTNIESFSDAEMLDPAFGTMVTGLEIDSTKSGLRTKNEIQKLQNLLGKEKENENEFLDYFLKIKDALKGKRVDTTKTKSYIYLRQIFEFITLLCNAEKENEAFEKLLDLKRASKTNDFINLFFDAVFQRRESKIIEATLLTKDDFEKLKDPEKSADPKTIIAKIRDIFWDADNADNADKLNLTTLSKALTRSIKEKSAVLDSYKAYEKGAYELFILGKSEDPLLIYHKDSIKNQNRAPINLLPYLGFEHMFLEYQTKKPLLKKDDLTIWKSMIRISLEYGGDCGKYDLTEITAGQVLDAMDGDASEESVQNAINRLQNYDFFAKQSDRYHKLIQYGILTHIHNETESITLDLESLLSVGGEKAPENIAEEYEKLRKYYRDKEKRLVNYCKEIFTEMVEAGLILAYKRYESNSFLIHLKRKKLKFKERCPKNLKNVLDDLVSAFEEIGRTLKLLVFYRGFESDDELGRVITRIQMQPGPVTDNDAKTIFTDIRDSLNLKESMTRQTISKGLTKMISENWLYFDVYKERKAELQEILQETLNDKSIGETQNESFLLQFNNGGWIILYYLLKSLQTLKGKDPSQYKTDGTRIKKALTEQTKAYYQHIHKQAIPAQEEDKKSSDEINKIVVSELKKCILTIYEQKDPKDLEEFARLIHNRDRESSDSLPETALRYIYRRNNGLFWKLIPMKTLKELLQNNEPIEKEKEEDVE